VTVATANTKTRNPEPGKNQSKMSTPMAFGRHETFHIRDGWLAKGVYALSTNPRGLHEADAHHSLGVGINMLKAIRYWVEAAGLAETIGKLANEKEMRLTYTGSLIQKHDPYFDNDGTWWIVHAGLARNRSLATTLYWLFNHGPSSRFQLEDLEQNLIEYVSTASRPPTLNTLRRDLQCLIRTYVGRDQAGRRAGDVDPIGCPLGALGLLRSSETPGEHQLTSSGRPTLDPHIFMSVLTEFVKKNNADSRMTTIEDARWSVGSPGRIFGMSNEAISEMIVRCRTVFGEESVAEIRTAGLSNIQIGLLESRVFLVKYFEGLSR